MLDRRPSILLPESNEAMFGLLLLYSVTLLFMWGLAPCALFGMFVLRPSADPGPLSLIVVVGSGFAAVGLELGVVALVRHRRYVRPYLREAAHRCPACDYEIGEDRMEHGCPECGWQRGSA